MRFIAGGMRFRGGVRPNTFFVTLAASVWAIPIFFMLATQAHAKETETKDFTTQANQVTATADAQAGDVTVKIENRFSKEPAVISEQTTEVIQTQVQGERSSQLRPFPEIRVEEGPQLQASEAPGPLAGVETITRDTNSDQLTDLIIVPRNCKAQEGASLVLEDDDGTQGTFIDNRNVEINRTPNGLRVVSSPPQGPNPPDPIKARLVRGGDGTLDGGGLTVATSTDIVCKDSDDEGNGGGGNGGGGNGEPGDQTQNPEPQDQDQGPLADGTARGNDVLVPGDVIDTLPDGTEVVGIDQITIETENCELTEQGDDLTVTLSDQGVPFRIRDGDNVDITLQEDGTIVANGRKTLGASFPEGQRDNPDRLIVPIPVDPENDQFPEAPNDTFPIISSTGIGGEGCRVIEQSDEPGTEDVAADEDVIDDTIPDDTLPDTGGPPLLGVVLLGFALVAAGAFVIRGGQRSV